MLRFAVMGVDFILIYYGTPVPGSAHKDNKFFSFFKFPTLIFTLK